MGYASHVKKQVEMKWTEQTITEGILKLANQFEPPRMPTNKEVMDMTNSRALSMAIQKTGGYIVWSEKLGLPQKYSETKMGALWESIIADILEAFGHKVEMTSTKYPYDILVDECVKIDVKAANASKVKDSDVYAYRISKPLQTCDFYVCCENDGEKRMYVIPSNAVKGQKMIEMGSLSTKYSIYRDAFYLIDETVKHFKSMVAPF